MNQEKVIYVMKEITAGLFLFAIGMVALFAPNSPLMGWMYGSCGTYVVFRFIYKDIKRKLNGCDCE